MPHARALQALEDLKAGNARFVANAGRVAATIGADHRAALVGGQSPHAIVLGCSDSRVPAELVFDQGLGALFVIRVAGNIVAPTQVASVEFAADRFDTRLVVVLGHSSCGAVAATLEAIQNGSAAGTRNLQSIVERIRPTIVGLTRTLLAGDPQALMREAVRANVRASVNHLRHGSELLERLAREDGLMVVGAEYDLESGVVEFFE